MNKVFWLAAVFVIALVAGCQARPGGPRRPSSCALMSSHNESRLMA